MMGGSNYLFLLLGVPSLLIVLWAARLFYILWLKPKMLEYYFRKQGMNGLSYKMDGNMKEIIEMHIEAKSKPLGLTHDFVPFFTPISHKMLKKYGKIFLTWFGTRPQVVVVDNVLIKEILMNKAEDYLKIETTPSSKLFLSGIASFDGEKWENHRRIINPAFYMQKLKYMIPTLASCCDDFIERWEKVVAPTGSCELDMCVEMPKITGDVISRVAFGCTSEVGSLIIKLQAEQGRLFLSEFVEKPSLFSIMPKKINPRRLKVNDDVSALLKEVIKKRAKAMELGEIGVHDLLGVMMESNITESQESNSSKNKAMSMDELIEECRSLYFGGAETIGQMLIWTTVVLSMHPTWQDKAREEVLQLVGKSSPKFEDLQHFNILSMIFQEVLRLYTPTPLIRRTRRKTKLGDFTLPANTQIHLDLLQAHRDTEQWGSDANEFNPNRFSEGIANASKNQSAFYPFGWGPRKCIGLNFSMLEAKMVFAKILQHFYLDLSPSYTHSPTSHLTLTPQFGAQIILRKL